MGQGELACQHVSQVTWPGGLVCPTPPQATSGGGSWSAQPPHSWMQIPPPGCRSPMGADPPPCRPSPWDTTLRDTVNKRAVRILLECILFIGYINTRKASCRNFPNNEWRPGFLEKYKSQSMVIFWRPLYVHCVDWLIIHTFPFSIDSIRVSPQILTSLRCSHWGRKADVLFPCKQEIIIFRVKFANFFWKKQQNSSFLGFLWLLFIFKISKFSNGCILFCSARCVLHIHRDVLITLVSLWHCRSDVQKRMHPMFHSISPHQ